MTLGTWTGRGKRSRTQGSQWPWFCAFCGGGGLGSPSLEAGFVDPAFIQCPGSQGTAVNESKVFGHVSGRAKGTSPMKV